MKQFLYHVWKDGIIHPKHTVSEIVFWFYKFFSLRFDSNTNIDISLLDFNLDEDDSGHHIYRMRDEYGRDFSDMWELHIIELKKVFEPEDALAD